MGTNNGISVTAWYFIDRNFYVHLAIMEWGYQANALRSVIVPDFF